MRSHEIESMAMRWLLALWLIYWAISAIGIIGQPRSPGVLSVADVLKGYAFIALTAWLGWRAGKASTRSISNE